MKEELIQDMKRVKVMRSLENYERKEMRQQKIGWKTHIEDLNKVNDKKVKDTEQLKREDEELHRSNSITKEEVKMEANDIMAVHVRVSRRFKGWGHTL